MAELRLSPSRLRREGDALAGLPYAQVYRTKGHPERAGAVLGATLILGQ